MLTLIIIVVVCLIWLNNLPTSSSNHPNSTTTNTTHTPTISPKTTTPIPINPLPVSVSPKTTTPSVINHLPISVSPKTIQSTPEKKISLVDGEYRYFQNHYINGTQYTFGFPKENCKDKRVWVGIDNDEIERISYSEAKRRIANKLHLPQKTNYISPSSYTNNNVGYCSNCNKKLRGNIYKSHCTECWHKGYR